MCSAGGSTPTPGPTRPPPTSKLIPVKPTETKVMFAPCWATFLKKMEWQGNNKKKPSTCWFVNRVIKHWLTRIFVDSPIYQTKNQSIQRWRPLCRAILLFCHIASFHRSHLSAAKNDQESWFRRQIPGPVQSRNTLQSRKWGCRWDLSSLKGKEKHICSEDPWYHIHKHI